MTVLSLFKKKYPAELMGHNLTVHAIEVDACAKMASLLRTCPVPDGVLISEIAFLRASAVRYAFDQSVSAERAEVMKQAALKVVLDTFAGEDDDADTDEVTRHYAGRPLVEVARSTMAAYAEHSDIPMLTCPIFVARVRAPAMVNYELQDLVDELVRACSKTLSSFKIV